MKRIGWLGLGLVWVGGIVAGVACGSSDGAVDIGAPDSGSPSPTTTPTTSSTTPGGGTSDEAGPGDDAGQPVTDGGDNIDPDAGDLGDASLPDGGACNTLDNTAPAITSDCASLIPILGGGTIQPGTYFLTSVTDLGTPSFCKNNFVPEGFKETMAITVDTAIDGGFVAQTVTKLATGPNRPRTETIVPTQGTTHATITGVCPVTASANTEYGVGQKDGKPALRMILPYGRGQAVYVFEKQ